MIRIREVLNHESDTIKLEDIDLLKNDEGRLDTDICFPSMVKMLNAQAAQEKDGCLRLQLSDDVNIEIEGTLSNEEEFLYESSVITHVFAAARENGPVISESDIFIDAMLKDCRENGISLQSYIEPLPCQRDIFICNLQDRENLEDMIDSYGTECGMNLHIIRQDTGEQALYCSVTENTSLGKEQYEALRKIADQPYIMNKSEERMDNSKEWIIEVFKNQIPFEKHDLTDSKVNVTLENGIFLYHEEDNVFGRQTTEMTQVDGVTPNIMDRLIKEAQKQGLSVNTDKYDRYMGGNHDLSESEYRLLDSYKKNMSFVNQYGYEQKISLDQEGKFLLKERYPGNEEFRSTELDADKYSNLIPKLVSEAERISEYVDKEYYSEYLPDMERNDDFDSYLKSAKEEADRCKIHDRAPEIDQDLFIS